MASAEGQSISEDRRSTERGIKRESVIENRESRSKNQESRFKNQKSRIKNHESRRTRNNIEKERGNIMGSPTNPHEQELKQIRVSGNPSLRSSDIFRTCTKLGMQLPLLEIQDDG